jgi:hypothetical protein
MSSATALATVCSDAPRERSVLRKEKLRIVMKRLYDTATYMVSYVGKWKYPQLGKHIRAFWTETPSQSFPLLEIAELNGNICVSFLQPFSERLYYDALLEKLRENGIPYRECGTAPVNVAEISTGE